MVEENPFTDSFSEEIPDTTKPEDDIEQFSSSDQAQTAPDLEDTEISENSETAEPKTPFAKEGASLSGMVASVLKPQDEKERQKIEREFKKRQEKIEKQKGNNPIDFEKILIMVIIFVMILGVLITVLSPIGKKTYRAIAEKKWTIKLPGNEKLKIWDDTQVIYENTFRLTLKSNTGADKATLVLTNGAKSNNISGRILAQDTQGLTWEFYVNDLAKGKYTYKAFIKNSKRDELKELRGTFELK